MNLVRNHCLFESFVNLTFTNVRYSFIFGAMLNLPNFVVGISKEWSLFKQIIDIYRTSNFNFPLVFSQMGSYVFILTKLLNL